MKVETAKNISDVVYNKLSEQLKNQESPVDTLGLNGICDIVLNAIIDYHEPIDNQKVDNEARQYSSCVYSSECDLSYLNPEDVTKQVNIIYNVCKDGFVAGYCKAKQE